MRGNQRIALTKRLLQEALIRLLEKKPLDKITVTELCSEAGINRATFYRHYNIPRDVLLDMETQFNENLNTALDAISGTDVTGYMNELMTYLSNHVDLVKIFLENNSADDFMRQLNKMFDNFLNGNNNFSLLSDADAKSVKLIKTYITGGGYYMLRQWLLEDIQKTPEEIAGLVLKLVNHT